MDVWLRVKGVCPRRRWLFAFALAVAGVTSHASGANELALREVPSRLAVSKALPAPPIDVIELRFRDLYTMPVGPRGLEPSDSLRAAEGRLIRIVGFMVREEHPSHDGFLLAPLPVATGDEDEGLADDLPPALIHVTSEALQGKQIPYLPGLLQIHGILHLGTDVNADTQRVTAIQLEPDRRTRRALEQAIAKGDAPKRPRHS